MSRRCALSSSLSRIRSPTAGCSLRAAQRFDQLFLAHVRAAGDIGLLRAVVELRLGELGEAVACVTSARRLEARLERGHEVGRGPRLIGRRRLDRLAGALGLDDLSVRYAIGLLVLLHFVRSFELVD